MPPMVNSWELTEESNTSASPLGVIVIVVFFSAKLFARTREPEARAVAPE